MHKEKHCRDFSTDLSFVSATEAFTITEAITMNREWCLVSRFIEKE